MGRIISIVLLLVFCEINHGIFACNERIKIYKLLMSVLLAIPELGLISIHGRNKFISMPGRPAAQFL